MAPASRCTFDNLSKREKLQITRQRAKLEKTLGSIVDLTRLPSALFVVDVMKEHIAVREANRLGIPVFGMVDTNSNPNNIDYVIPANDDATKSVEVILGAICEAMNEGLLSGTGTTSGRCAAVTWAGKYWIISRTVQE